MDVADDDFVRFIYVVEVTYSTLVDLRLRKGNNGLGLRAVVGSADDITPFVDSWQTNKGQPMIVAVRGHAIYLINRQVI